MNHRVVAIICCCWFWTGLTGTVIADSTDRAPIPAAIADGADRPPIPTAIVEEYFSLAESDCDSLMAYVCQDALSPRTVGWQVLPDDLLWHSYLAGPHEPRMSMVFFGDSESNVYWDATLGGRVGFLRYNSLDGHRRSAWQWDFEGAVITRLDLLHAEDVESMDYRFGTEITAAEGPWAAKFGYFHVSSHVGDEYLIRNSTFQRTNYVTESLVLGVGNTGIESFRVYGETAYAFHVAGGADNWQFQTGLEYTPRTSFKHSGAPFSALNLDIREAVDFDPTLTFQTGWLWQGLESARRLRFGLQLGNGPTSQFSFFRRREKYLGMGVWYDY